MLPHLFLVIRNCSHSQLIYRHLETINLVRPFEEHNQDLGQPGRHNAGLSPCNASLRYRNSPAHSTADSWRIPFSTPRTGLWMILLALAYSSTSEGGLIDCSRKALLRLLCRATKEHSIGEGRAQGEGRGDVCRPRRRHCADKSVLWRMPWQQEKHWGVRHGQGGWLGENCFSTGRNCEVIPTVSTLRLHPFRVESVDLSAKSHGSGWRRVRTTKEHHLSTVHSVSAWEGSSWRRAHTVLPSSKARGVGNLWPYVHGLISLHYLESCHWSPTNGNQDRRRCLHRLSWGMPVLIAHNARRPYCHCCSALVSPDHLLAVPRRASSPCRLSHSFNPCRWSAASFCWWPSVKTFFIVTVARNRVNPRDREQGREGKDIFSSLSLTGLPASKYMFVVLTAHSMPQMVFLDIRSIRLDCLVLKLFYQTDLRNTDRPTHVSLRKNRPNFRKAYMFM